MKEGEPNIASKYEALLLEIRDCISGIGANIVRVSEQIELKSLELDGATTYMRKFEGAANIRSEEYNRLKADSENLIKDLECLQKEEEELKEVLKEFKATLEQCNKKAISAGVKLSD